MTTLEFGVELLSSGGIVRVQQQLEFADFEVLRNAVQDAPTPMDIVQLGQGEMAGTLAHLSVGSVGISTGSFTRGVRQRGVLSTNRWTFGMLLGSSALLQHFEATPGDLIVIAPDQELYSRFINGNHYATTLVAPDELFAFLATQPGAQDVAAWHQPTTMLASDRATTAANVKQMSMILAALTEHGPKLSVDAADFFKRNILELVTAPVRDTVRYRGARVLAAAKLVREVDRYMIDAGSRPIHISELCAHFSVGRRTLHRAFNEVVGISPIAFMRRKRLGDVHTVLLTGGPDATIKDVAIEHGFIELGRFAGAYRRLFGELPSQTLRRAQHR
ncbi:AraC family transcriptional regulator [Bradyrhizobium sp. 6(2017)]|uniref:AraC family transcriptional regulator n=1 Tax=Bradyrhizobium sp. 6(2017) TaxID=1197460 RepID=UPI0013E0FE2C|nr:helix-turn-helix domain-containing protein [Bradyrhizobium sp. 6(2017)]QIG93828.1 AraC family transcriptional regulator [Bradyrhizobium sp. 6(2017)]